ncbi:MAG: MjaI family restriction endonuclease [Calditrichaceae bacterium]
MADDEIKKVAKSFGKKEKVLNYTSNTYQLTRPKKVGEVMALIRECQPKSFDEWQEYYWANAYTKTKKEIKVTEEILTELGERLYEKITEVVIPEWSEAFKQITKQDCLDYIREVTIFRTYDGFVTEKSVVNDILAKEFPNVKFTESDPELDHAGDIDYLGNVNDKAFGIQIKPITATANFGNYSISDRMRQNFDEFEEAYGGRVFIIFSSKINDKKQIRNKDILEEIRAEIERLNS